MSYLLATNSFHNTSTAAATLASCVVDDLDSNEPLELVQVDFELDKLCNNQDCGCHVVDQKVFMYDYDGTMWFLRSSFETTGA